MELLHLPEYSLKLSVVEDDPIILHDITMMIEGLGHTVHSTYRSGEGLIASGPPYTMDMLIVDIELGGRVNGIDAVTAVLMNRSIPVIYLTSYSDSETFRKILHTNPYGYIIKPATCQQLKIAVDIAYFKFILDRRNRENEKRYQSIVETLPLMIARFEPESGTVTFCNGAFSTFFGCRVNETCFFELDHVQKLGDMRTVYSRFSVTNDSSRSEIQLECQGELIWFNVICQALFDDRGSLFEYQFIAEDITERKRAVGVIQKKTDELNSRIRDLKCLYAISNILGEPKNIGRMLQRIVDELTVALNDSENIALCIEYGDKSYFSYNYFSTIPNYNNPIVVNNSIVGNIRINITEEKRLSCFITEEEAELISTVSELISKTVVKIEAENRLKKLEREIIMISERERQNLGHELHDGIGQILTGTSFLVKSLEKRFQLMDVDTPKELSEISGHIRDATMRCRRLSKGLVPVSYTNETFIYLVEQLLLSTREMYQLDFQISIPEEFIIRNSFVTSQLFRIVQEAVNNVVKHAHATCVHVSVEDDGTGVTLTVSDDGSGMTQDSSMKGLGLSIMRYRTDLIGADFEIYSMENSGTAILVHISREMIRYREYPVS